MAFRKEILRIVLPFPSKIPMHDIWIGFIAELFYKSSFIYTPLIKYRRHSHNASMSTNISYFSIWQKICFRINVIRYIFGAYFRYIKYRK
jgi:hypothetical protein